LQIAGGVAPVPLLQPILSSSWKPLLLSGRKASLLMRSVSFQSTAAGGGGASFSIRWSAYKQDKAHNL
jgi:hypothetical protein